MEKVKINNQVIFMRKHVKQAKLHVINKLTKEIRLLQTRKGNEKLVAKSKRKAERFIEEINILKKTKPDYVSTLALSKTQDWKRILEQKNSSLENRCLARLATFGAVQKQIENFYNSNVNLIPKIPECIKEWEQRKKFPMKLSKGPRALNMKNIKQQDSNKRILPLQKNDSSKNASKIQVDKNTSICHLKGEFSNKGEEDSHQEDEEEIKSKQEVEMDVNLDKMQNKNSASKNDLSEIEKSILNSGILVKNNVMNEESSSDSDDNGLELVSSDTMTNIPQTKVLRSKNFQKAKESSADSENETRTINSDDKSPQQVSMKSLSNTKISQITKDPVQYYNNSTKSSLKTITVLNLDDLQELEEIPVNKLFKNEEEACESDSDQVASLEEESDTFFLRGTETDSVQTKTHSVQTSEFDFSKVHPNNLPFMSKDKKFHGKDSKWSSNGKPSVKRGFQKSFNNFNSIKSNDISFKKHRSYSKESIQRYEPEGKRFKKDEFYPKNSKKFKKGPGGELSFQLYKRDSDDKYSNKLKYEKGTNFSHQRTTVNKKDNVKPLHPSWEAKKKQKELIKTQFQGKRIVFDD